MLTHMTIMIVLQDADTERFGNPQTITAIMIYQWLAMFVVNAGSKGREPFRGSHTLVL